MKNLVANPPVGLVPTEDASHGCFETMRVYQGRIFRLDAHLDRLFASAKFLGTPMPMDRTRLARQLRAALESSRLREAVVRVAMMPQPAGPAMPSIVVQPAIVSPAWAYARGIRLAVVPARKFSVGSISPQAKYSARLGSVLAVMDAQLRGVDEALFLDEVGSVTESTASNIGIIAGGAIVTPPCWLGLLAGITRDVLTELAAIARLPIREAPLTRHELYNAEEAFLSSTLKEILPVTWIDGRRIGTGRPGPLTRKLHRAFRQLVRRDLGK
ncbi:MAG: aminotransferase [Candidatus Omnitrophica bacterium CG11_big_fil_rev_8_21_14_0_20_63_9]|nr:MAG: aminotransferase [Candidatus Omnitrophica bacterium CG11_big_fil_rev_8_21_14_0_20_63_9]